MYIRLLCVILFAWFLSGIMGCNSSDSNPTVDPDAVARLELTPDDEPFISISQAVQLGIFAFNVSGNAVPTGFVEWSSSDPGVLTVSSIGQVIGMSAGTATVTAEANEVAASLEFHVVDLTGVWEGGEDPDMVTYTLTQTDESVDGTFESLLGFPPITDINTGALTGSLNFSTYAHVLELTTEDGCNLLITGNHFLALEDGELILTPSTGVLSSTNCSISGTISFATLRRQD